MSNYSRGTTVALAAVLLATLGFTLLSSTATAAGLKPLSAGVSKQGRAPHPEYPLKLVFATHGGAYLAGVQVRLLDSAGNAVLETRAEGPWLFLDVPPGRYTVRATRTGGVTRAIAVEVTGSEQTVATLTWKAAG